VIYKKVEGIVEDNRANVDLSKFIWLVVKEIDLFGFDFNIKRDWWWSIILSN